MRQWQTRNLIAALAIVLAIGVVIAIRGTAAAGDPNEKQLIEQRYQQDKLVSPRVVGSPSQERPTGHVTNPPAPTGVLETHDAPFPTTEFLASNRWQGVIGGRLVSVIAGGIPNSTTGVLMVLGFSEDTTKIIDSQRVILPGAPGSARVLSATGTLVQIQTASGKQFTFDAATRVLTASP